MNYNKQEMGAWMYSIKVAKYENGYDKYVVVNENYEVFEPLLLYADRLYASHKLNTIYDYMIKVVKFLACFLRVNTAASPKIAPIFVPPIQKE